jgi:pimeloyl-ACP methyl ester carboxylesterase
VTRAATLLGASLCLLLAGAPPHAERVAVDGAELYLLVRGEEASAPLVLWLHGGPGGAETPLFRLFNGALEERFVVAYWDQRGAGRSFHPDADPRELTIARHLADLDAIVDHLRAALGRERVALIGHSWGSALGLLYARAHPDKVHAFIGVGQLTAELARQRAQHEFVRGEAERLRDDDAREALAEIGEPPLDARRELALERLVDRFGGVFHRRPSFTWALLRGTVFGYAAPWEIPRFIRANEISLEAMNRELLALDLTRSVPRVDVPVFFFLGRHDRQVDSRLAAAYFEALEAPRKQLVWFEHSAHNPPFEEAEAFNAAIIRALATSTGSSSAPAQAMPR